MKPNNPSTSKIQIRFRPMLFPLGLPPVGIESLTMLGSAKITVTPQVKLNVNKINSFKLIFFAFNLARLSLLVTSGRKPSGC